MLKNVLAACILGTAGLALAAAPATRPSTQPSPGQAAPGFALNDQDGKPVSLADYRGKWVVLYFYPKAATPGCTVEACEFTEGIEAFSGLNAAVVGVSPDSPEELKKFEAKEKLRVKLLSDPQRTVMAAYGAWRDGKVVRSTVLIDPQGFVRWTWPQVVPKGHAQQVRQKLAEIGAAAGPTR